jgi:hypothetical protein
MRHDAASEKVFGEAASRQAAKIGVIASPFFGSGTAQLQHSEAVYIKSSATATTRF